MRRVAIAILSYLRANPHAKDNLEGIARWWVNEECQVVQKSLALLLEIGAVETSRDHYALSTQFDDSKAGTAIEDLMKCL